MPKSPQTLLILTVALSALCAAFAAGASAGPWIKAPGEAFVKGGLTHYSAEDSFNQGRDTGMAYTGQTFNVYGEVGLVEGLQAVVDLPVVMGVNTSAAGVRYTNQSLGDLRLELDGALLPELPLAIGVETKIPLYTPIGRQGPGDPAADFPRSRINFPDPGDGNVDMTLKLLTGLSLHPTPAWVTAELGYRARFGGFVDGLTASLGAGWFVWPEHVALGLYGNALVNLGQDADPALRSTKQFTYVQAFVLITAAPLADDLSLTLSAGAVVQADNTSRGTDLGLGVSYAF